MRMIGLMMTVWLLGVSITDIRHRRVSIGMLMAGGGLTAAAVIYQLCAQETEYSEAFKGMLPGIGLLLIALMTKKAGTGDGIVLIFLGVMLGGGRSFMLLGLSLFFISICSIVLLALRKVKRNTGIPYLPFLTAAWIVMDRLSG